VLGSLAVIEEGSLHSSPVLGLKWQGYSRSSSSVDAMNPFHLIGLALFATSFVLVAGTVFSSGGLSKSAQLGVARELLSGKHGATRRALFLAGLVAFPLGAGLTFFGVARSDRARAVRCDDYCRSLGHPRGRIGAAREKKESRPRPACLCEGGSMEPSEIPADDVPRR